MLEWRSYVAVTCHCSMSGCDNSKFLTLFLWKAVDDKIVTAFEQIPDDCVVISSVRLGRRRHLS